MGLRKVSILFLVLTIIIIAIPGCDNSGNDSLPTSPEDYRGSEGMTLSLSPVPKLGETAELTSYPTAMYIEDPEGLAKAQVWVEFYYANTRGSYSEAKYAVPIPLEEVLVSGELAWDGNFFEDGVHELHATIQLPREGVWIIIGYLSGKGWEKPLGHRGLFAVTEDAAADMNTLEYKSGPLGYLDNFSYGRLWERAPDDHDPVVLELDISKVPSVGEEATLTCRISSIIDWEGYSAEFRFGKRGDDNRTTFMTGESLLVDGDLSWEGDLKKGKPFEFSATIKLPEDGDWMAQALGDDPKSPGNHLADTIKMNIAGERGSFGWGGITSRCRL